MPSILPFSSGRTIPIARAAPVEVGIRLIAAARARRRSLCGRSRMLLVVRVRVDRRHEAALDRVRLVQELRDRRDAVRRARRVRDDVVLLRVVVAVVDAEDEGDVRIGRRRRDDDLLRARVEVLLRRLALREEPGRLDRDVDAELAPRQLGRVALGEELDLVAADPDEAVAGLDRLARACPSTESCLSRCAIVFVSPMSFAATISKSPPRSSCARRKLRPIRPNPLIPTLIFAIVVRPFVFDFVSPSLTRRLRCEIGTKSACCTGFPAKRRRAGGEAPRTTLPSGQPHPRPWRRTGSESAAGRARTRRGEYD